ncbi:MAG: serine dehydratase subunit alpha family protein [Lachnospirales bacterium]
MDKNDNRYTMYCNILKEELLPAMGCTEPIAIAYAGAKGREALGNLPDRVLVEVSGSIIKNVKSVIVPNTNHLKGINSSAAAGIVAGQPDKGLEVISKVRKEQILEINDFLKNIPIEIKHIDNGLIFEIILTVFKGDSYAKVHIVDYHTNIILIEKDGEAIFVKKQENATARIDRSVLNMESIWDFANTVNINDIVEVLEKQVKYNYAIAEEGLKGNYGANIGKVSLNSYKDVKTKAKAMAAAGSDARMNGCELPVVINSGSGNQGITCSVPIIVYAKELQVSEEKMYRALVLSNLTAIHQKTGIGTLSAYCGVVSAGIGAGVGIVYLHDGTFEDASHTIVNTLAIISGMICDGAKASCAAKIVAAIDAVLLGYDMYKQGQQFYAGDGIVEKGVEETIKNIGRLCQNGMKSTNEEIIKIMVGN